MEAVRFIDGTSSAEAHRIHAGVRCLLIVEEGRGGGARRLTPGGRPRRHLGADSAAVLPDLNASKRSALLGFAKAESVGFSTGDGTVPRVHPVSVGLVEGGVLMIQPRLKTRLQQVVIV